MRSDTRTLRGATAVLKGAAGEAAGSAGKDHRWVIEKVSAYGGAGGFTVVASDADDGSGSAVTLWESNSGETFLSPLRADGGGRALTVAPVAPATGVSVQYRLEV